jgi:hypothetical protein
MFRLLLKNKYKPNFIKLKDLYDRSKENIFNQESKIPLIPACFLLIRYEDKLFFQISWKKSYYRTI